MEIDNEYNQILENIESMLLLRDACPSPMNITPDAFRASVKIFMTALMNKMWYLQEAEGMDIADRANMAEQAGGALRALIKTYTGVDTFDMYSK